MTLQNPLHMLDDLGVAGGCLAQLDFRRQLVHVVGVINPLHLSGGNSDGLGDAERQPLVESLKLIEPAQVEPLDLAELLKVDLNGALGLLNAGHAALVGGLLVADGGEVVKLDGLVGVQKPGEHLGLAQGAILLLDVDELSQLALNVGVRSLGASLVDLGDLRLVILQQLCLTIFRCHNVTS